MSAPDTNTDRQTAQHKVPLAGIGLAALVAVGLVLYLIAGQFTDTEDTARDAGGMTPDAVQEGDVVVPDTAPTQDVAPGDPASIVTPDP